MNRKASAVWKGNLKEGTGRYFDRQRRAQRHAVFFQHAVQGRHRHESEELIAAAHAGCFSMALSGQLENAGMVAESIDTTANVTLEKTDAGFTITLVHLDVKVKIPGANQQAFETAANNAKAGCPISRVLNTKITMDAKLTA